MHPNEVQSRAKLFVLECLQFQEFTTQKSFCPEVDLQAIPRRTVSLYPVGLGLGI